MPQEVEDPKPLKNLILACALRREARTLERGLGGGHRCLVTGMGARRTEASLRRLLKKLPPSLFIFTGTAGQLDPSLKRGEVLLPRAWLWPGAVPSPADPELLDSLRQAGWPVGGLGITVPRPVLRASSRLRLFQQTSARICDMESAVALAVARECGMQALAVKVVSDTSRDGVFEFFSNFNQSMEHLAAALNRLLPTLADGPAESRPQSR